MRRKQSVRLGCGHERVGIRGLSQNCTVDFWRTAANYLCHLAWSRPHRFGGKWMVLAKLAASLPEGCYYLHQANEEVGLDLINLLISTSQDTRLATGQGL